MDCRGFSHSVGFPRYIVCRLIVSVFCVFRAYILHSVVAERISESNPNKNLLVLVRGQYDNMQGSLDNVNKRRKKLLYLWKKLPLFTMSTQEPQWQYRLPWNLS